MSDTTLEPHSPWDGSMLTLRRDCYVASGDPLLAAAERDLATFAALETPPFVVGAPATAR